jgi:hypothetical protein
MREIRNTIYSIILNDLFRQENLIIANYIFMIL